MNYFLKKIGYKYDRLSVGLNRLSLALIIISVMYIPIFFHKQSNFFYICIADILIYLFFTLLALVISGCRYGFRQYHSQKFSKLHKRKINFLYFFSLKQMGIKNDTIFYIIQGIGAGFALLVVIPFIGIFILMCGLCFVTNPWPTEEYFNDIGIGISSGKDLLGVFVTAIIIGALVYVPFILFAWVFSGFLYGYIQGERKVIPLLYTSDLSSCMCNIKKDFGQLNWRVDLCAQQRIILKGSYQLSEAYQVEVIAEEVSFFRGCVVNWSCDVSEKQFVRPNVNLDTNLNIMKSLAFYDKDDREVFLIAAEKLLVSFNTVNDYT